MAVKDGDLYVGSHGTEVPKGGKVDHSLQVRRAILIMSARIDSFAKWVKVISPAGKVSHVDWTEKYHALAKALGVFPSGYGATSILHHHQQHHHLTYTM